VYVVRYLIAILILASPAFAAWEYDGTGDSHQVNNPDGGVINGFTVCAWVYNASWDDGETIFAYGNGIDSSAGRGFSLTTETDGSLRIDYWDGSTANNAFPSATMSDATWHHLCLVRVNTGDNFIYLDATDSTPDSDEAIDPPAAPNSTDDFWIAQDAPATTGFGRANAAFRAVHVGYWNVALSGAEVASLADKSTCPTAVQASNLKVFVRGNVDPAVDDSGNGLTVTTNGGPTLVADPSGLPCGGSASIIPLLTESWGY
jgi:hypothetical protein